MGSTLPVHSTRRARSCTCLLCLPPPHLLPPPITTAYTATSATAHHAHHCLHIHCARARMRLPLPAHCLPPHSASALTHLHTYLRMTLTRPELMVRRRRLAANAITGVGGATGGRPARAAHYLHMPSCATAQFNLSIPVPSFNIPTPLCRSGGEYLLPDTPYSASCGRDSGLVPLPTRPWTCHGFAARLDDLTRTRLRQQGRHHPYLITPRRHRYMRSPVLPLPPASSTTTALFWFPLDNYPYSSPPPRLTCQFNTCRLQFYTTACALRLPPYALVLFHEHGSYHSLPQHCCFDAGFGTAYRVTSSRFPHWPSIVVRTHAGYLYAYRLTLLLTLHAPHTAHAPVVTHAPPAVFLQFTTPPGLPPYRNACGRCRLDVWLWLPHLLRHTCHATTLQAITLPRLPLTMVYTATAYNPSLPFVCLTPLRTLRAGICQRACAFSC